ncbi:MAG: hypothetical protein GF416_00855 [Candidatus Altiarchaeales archaeon]|nr:hypothetical protein [Candidatus Altiarchaeales archaeon]MBD3415667.1 hypothetical protein [Candidatus Altiarchaeales archaeon]
MVRDTGDRGLMGLGALIILIAILLAASVAALVLISTNQSLVRRHEQTQKEKTQSIQHPIIVEMVKGWDGNADGDIDRLGVVVRLHWGDDPINFNRTVVMVDSNAINCTSIYYGSLSASTCEYTLNYLRQGSDWEQDYLHPGDMVEMRFSGSNLLGGVEDMDSKFTFMPSHGMPTRLRVEIPRRIYPANMELWPLND